jgi:hypothetical protein
MTDGGEGAKGLIQTEKHKQKIRENLIGKKASEETKQKMRNIVRPSGKNHARFGVKTSEETKQKMRERKIGKKASEETKQILSKKMSGKGNPKARKVICNITGKIYGCIKDAVKDSGVSYVTLKRYLNGKKPNKTTLKYV